MISYQESPSRKENIVQNSTEPNEYVKTHLQNSEKQIQLKSQKQKSKFEAYVELQARLEASSAYLDKSDEMEAEYQEKLNEYSLLSDSIIADYISSLFSITSPNTEVEKKLQELSLQVSALKESTTKAQNILVQTQEEIIQTQKQIASQEIEKNNCFVQRQKLESDKAIISKEIIDLELELMSAREINAFELNFQQRNESPQSDEANSISRLSRSISNASSQNSICLLSNSRSDSLDIIPVQSKVKQTKNKRQSGEKNQLLLEDGFKNDCTEIQNPITNPPNSSTNPPNSSTNPANSTTNPANSSHQFPVLPRSSIAPPPPSQKVSSFFPKDHVETQINEKSSNTYNKEQSSNKAKSKNKNISSLSDNSSKQKSSPSQIHQNKTNNVSGINSNSTLIPDPLDTLTAETSSQLPKELFREPYRVRIPLIAKKP